MLASKGLQSAMIPKYSMMGPFRGHMSTKSSPFFTGSSCKLSTQYLIQDHMATHYRKILSAKAAVDSSTPTTLNTSIKYKDQKKKEQLMVSVEKYKKEIQRIRSTSPILSRSVSPEHNRGSIMVQDDLHLTQTARELLVTQREESRPVQKNPSRTSSPASIARDTVHGIVQHTISPPLRCQKSHTRVLSSSLYIQSMQHANSQKNKKPFQDPQKKTYSGDLLEKHSNRFSTGKKAFTPRTLKKSARSFLSKYRYYTAPKKNTSAGRSSSRSAEDYQQILKEMYGSIKDTYVKPEVDHHRLDTEKHLQEEEHRQLPKNDDSRHSQLLAKEEELKYLKFLREVTNDILMRGTGSGKVVNDVFRAQFESRRNDLDEVKMKKCFQELTEELTNSSKLDFSISYTGLQHNDCNSHALFISPSKDASFYDSHARSERVSGEDNTPCQRKSLSFNENIPEDEIKEPRTNPASALSTN